MPLKIERVVDSCMDEEEALCRFGRFEALHLPLSPPDRQVGVFRAIVGSQTLLMVAGKAEIAKRRSIRPEPVGYDRPRGKTLPLRQFSQQSQSGRFVATSLNQHVQYLTFAVDRPPQEHMSATNPDHHFVKVPSVIRPRALAHQAGGNLGPEFHRPATDALVTDVDASLSQQFLDIPITERETIVQPNCMADDVRWKLMASVRDRLHHPIISAGAFP